MRIENHSLRFRGAQASRPSETRRRGVLEGQAERNGAAAEHCGSLVSACCELWVATIDVGKKREQRRRDGRRDRMDLTIGWSDRAGGFDGRSGKMEDVDQVP